MARLFEILLASSVPRRFMRVWLPDGQPVRICRELTLVLTVDSDDGIYWKNCQVLTPDICHTVELVDWHLVYAPGVRLFACAQEVDVLGRPVAVLVEIEPIAAGVRLARGWRERA